MILQETDSTELIWQKVNNELKKGCTAKRHAFRYAVLSTVDNGQPDSRWVVFRKITDAFSFLIYTDQRSTKVKHLKQNPKASLLFYNPRHGLQVRIGAKVILHHQNDLTNRYWPGVKGSSDADYTTLLPPGTPIGSPEDGHQWNKRLNDAHFMILEAVPSTIEILQLNKSKHTRIVFNKVEHSWEGQFLSP